MSTSIQYKLTVRQEPKHSRFCTCSSSSHFFWIYADHFRTLAPTDRRPIDPPPIIQLEVGGAKADPWHTIQNPNYLMFVSLAKPDAKDGDEELHWLQIEDSVRDLSFLLASCIDFLQGRCGQATNTLHDGVRRIFPPRLEGPRKWSPPRWLLRVSRSWRACRREISPEMHLVRNRQVSRYHYPHPRRQKISHVNLPREV